MGGAEAILKRFCSAHAASGHRGRRAIQRLINLFGSQRKRAGREALSRPISVSMLDVRFSDSEADGKSLIHPAHIRTAERAHFFLEALFVERAHLLEQDYRILGMSAAVRIDSYMSGKVGLILLAGYRRGYDRRAEAIADIVLNYQHGSYPALLGADDGTQISVVYISPFYCHF